MSFRYKGEPLKSISSANVTLSSRRSSSSANVCQGPSRHQGRNAGGFVWKQPGQVLCGVQRIFQQPPQSSLRSPLSIGSVERKVKFNDAYKKAFFTSVDSFERFSAFVEHYIRHLEPAAGPTRKAQDKGLNLAEITMQELKGFFARLKILMAKFFNFITGSRRGYYKIRQHYTILLRDRYSDSSADLLRGEFPALALGISGASLHCLEDLGYAACVGLPAGMVVDALAYLHHSFCPNFITISRQDYFRSYYMWHGWLVRFMFIGTYHCLGKETIP